MKERSRVRSVEKNEGRGKRGGKKGKGRRNEPIHHSEELLPDVLSRLHVSSLDEVLLKGREEEGNEEGESVRAKGRRENENETKEGEASRKGNETHLEAPRSTKLASLPPVVHRQQRQMISLGLMELRLLRIRLSLLVLRSVEHVLHRQHGDDRQDLLRASKVDRSDEHLGHGRIDREVGHLPSESSEESFVVERSESEEVLQGGDEGLGGRRIHEVEGDEVVDSHGFEGEDGRGEVGSLNFGDGVGKHLVSEGDLGVESVGFSGSSSSCST